MAAAVSAWFWNERFWLPQNVTWADLAEVEGGPQYPRAGHIVSVFPLALALFAIRLLFERSYVGVCLRRSASEDVGIMPGFQMKRVYS